MVKVNIQAHMQTTFGGGYFRPRVILALFETYSQRLQGGGGERPPTYPLEPLVVNTVLCLCNMPVF